MTPVFVYVIGPFGGPYKIGISSNVNERLGDLQTSSPVRLQLIAKKEFSDRDSARSAERSLHAELRFCRQAGEWFSADVSKIKALIEPDDEYELCDFDGETKEWFRRNMRGLSEFARGNLAKLYGIDTTDPDVLADFRSAQVIAGRV